MPRFAAAVLGASGQVGDFVVSSLLAEPRCSSVVLVNRRMLDGYDRMPRVKQYVVDMDKLVTEAVSVLKDNDVRVCFVCLGKPSTMTREELETVEVHVPTAFAKASRAAGCVRHISLLSSSAANVKKAEKNLKGVGLESVALFRPSRLVGSGKVAGCAPSIFCGAMPSSWGLFQARKTRVDALGEAMVVVAVLSLDEAGPASARYERKTLRALFVPS